MGDYPRLGMNLPTKTFPGPNILCQTWCLCCDVTPIHILGGKFYHPGNQALVRNVIYRLEISRELCQIFCM